MFGKLTGKFSTIVQNFAYKKVQKSSCKIQKNIINLKQANIHTKTRNKSTLTQFETDQLGVVARINLKRDASKQS